MTLFSAALLLFFIMDPFGNIPLFLTALKDVAPQRRTRVVLRELLIALAVLLVFLFAGRWLLEVMHISQSSLKIAGGILLLLIAMRMVYPSGSHVNEKVVGEPLIVPLAIPLTAGPSAMAAVIIIGSSDPDRWPTWLAAVILSWMAAALILLLGTKLSRLLGERGLVAIERLMGMLLVAIAVQLTMDGIAEFVPALQGMS